MTDATNGQAGDELFPRLARWLSARLPGEPAIDLADIAEPAQGFSSRTVMFTALWQVNGEMQRRPLVARLQRDVAVPMLADVFHQYRVMHAIAAHSQVKVPRIDFTESDPAVLGAPFFLMDRIDGRVPQDFPSHHAEGWFADITSDERERMWWNGVAEMEKLHRIDWRAFPFLAEGPDRVPDPAFYLRSFVGNWFDWARGGRSVPLIEDALRFLIAEAPPVTSAGLVWNDARLGNTMFASDGNVAALFDFEVATLGPAEIDLAHWIYLDEIFSDSFGIPRIDGLPRGKEAELGFERIYGRSMPNFSYYMAVAALKILILSVRDYGNDKDTPPSLSGFLVKRLEHYLDRYRSERC